MYEPRGLPSYRQTARLPDRQIWGLTVGSYEEATSPARPLEGGSECRSEGSYDKSAPSNCLDCSAANFSLISAGIAGPNTNTNDKETEDDVAVKQAHEQRMVLMKLI